MNARALTVCAMAAAASYSGLTLAHAQEPQTTAARPVDEAEVIRLAQVGAPGVREARANALHAQAAERSASRYPNPELAWEREHVPAGGGESEDVIALSVPISFSGERAARRSLARADLASAQADEALLRSEAVSAALRVFYRALAASARAEVMAAAVARLEAGAAVLARRHEAGAVSGYDRARVDIELELARSEQRQALASVEAAQVRLAALLGLPVGTLVPRGSLAPASAVAAGAGQPTSVQLDLAAADQARRAGQHADGAWVPTVNLQAGVKIADATSTELGYVAGLSFELPLSSAAEGLQAEAGATAAGIEARSASRARRRAVERDVALQQHAAMLAEIAALDSATAALLEGLERAVTSGYREGQRSVIELLDAQRVRTHVALRRIELLSAAREAELSMRAAGGEFE